MGKKKIIRSYTTAQLDGMFLPPLYRQKCVNYTSHTKDTDEPCTEYIARLVRSGELALSFPEGKVREEFSFPTHDGKIHEKVNENTTRFEPWWCIHQFRRAKAGATTPFGKAINYEVNLIPGTHTNIDLVARAEEDGRKVLYFIEVKAKARDLIALGANPADFPKSNGAIDVVSTETLLRCILEIRTYYELLERNGRLSALLSTLSAAPENGEKVGKVETDGTEEIRLGIWVPKDSQAAAEYREVLRGEPHRKEVAELLKKWNIRVEIMQEDA